MPIATQEGGARGEVQQKRPQENARPDPVSPYEKGRQGNPGGGPHGGGIRRSKGHRQAEPARKKIEDSQNYHGGRERQNLTFHLGERCGHLISSLVDLNEVGNLECCAGVAERLSRLWSLGYGMRWQAERDTGLGQAGRGTELAASGVPKAVSPLPLCHRTPQGVRPISGPWAVISSRQSGFRPGPEACVKELFATYLVHVRGVEFI